MNEWIEVLLTDKADAVNDNHPFCKSIHEMLVLKKNEKGWNNIGKGKE